VGGQNMDEVFAELGDEIERVGRGTMTISYETLMNHPAHSHCVCCVERERS
jgi:hypothetical protein